MEDRWITPEDYTTLELSLAGDSYHTHTAPEFFYASGSFCKVYEDSEGPILFLRGTKSLRIDIQFLDNGNLERNGNALKEGFLPFVEGCKKAGFTELVFNTDSPLLRRFCKNVLKFEDVEGKELRYLIG